MTDEDAGRVAFAQTIGDALNKFVWRVDLIVVLYKSPDLIDVVSKLIK